jgi:hypothetical protein
MRGDTLAVHHINDVHDVLFNEEQGHLYCNYPGSQYIYSVQNAQCFTYFLYKNAGG